MSWRGSQASSNSKLMYGGAVRPKLWILTDTASLTVRPQQQSWHCQIAQIRNHVMLFKLHQHNDLDAPQISPFPFLHLSLSPYRISFSCALYAWLFRVIPGAIARTLSILMAVLTLMGWTPSLFLLHLLSVLRTTFVVIHQSTEGMK